jgi:glycosyltransferase involved in cell wall biosynthesis
VIYTLHLAPIPIGGIWRRLSDFGDAVISPSDMGRQWITGAGRVAPARVSTIPHGVDLQKWAPGDPAQRHAARATLGLRQNSVVAAYVGRFEGPKNESWILDVAAECRQRNMDVEFVLCGDGPRSGEVQARIRSENLSGIVHLPGYVDPLPAYHAADLLMLPSSVEGFAYVAAEAAACGVAVLRTRTAGWQETVRDGITGRVVDIDRQQFIGTAVELLGDRQRLSQMGAAAITFAHEQLSIDRQVDRTLELYRRVLAGASTPAA